MIYFSKYGQCVWWVRHFAFLDSQGNIMMTSSNGSIFRVTDPLWGESTDQRWIPLTRPVTRSFDIFFDLQTVEQTIETPVIWYAIAIIMTSLWYNCVVSNEINHPAQIISSHLFLVLHDDVIKWKHFPRYRPFVREIHRSPVNSPHKGQWRGALMFSLICTWLNGWVNNRNAGDLRWHRVHFAVSVMA